MPAGDRTVLMLLGDVAAAYANATVLKYACCDYELPLLQGNALYRCAGQGNTLLERRVRRSVGRLCCACERAPTTAPGAGEDI